MAKKNSERNRIVIYDYLYTITVHKTDEEITNLLSEQKKMSFRDDDVHYIWISMCENILRQRENVAMKYIQDVPKCNLFFIK